MEQLKDKTSYVFTVKKIRRLTASAYVLQFDRNAMNFVPGQHLSVGLAGEIQAREYSVYSSVCAPFFEILVKEVEDGLVSKKLKNCKVGDCLRVNGPMGHFCLKPEHIEAKAKFLFVATGTGISPFHCFVKSYPSIDYQIIHGVRWASEAYEKEVYGHGRYTLCTSREKKGDFYGRVTSFLKTQTIGPSTLVYLCGNCDMIFEVFDLLASKGIPVENIQTEIYF